MLTLFTNPKPFRGHIGVIQRNALESWRRLGSDCEVLLLGDDEGVGETAKELGFTHLPEVARNEYGTPLVSSIFEVAEAHARFPLLCYVNADIILFPDLLEAARKIHRRKFLMLGKRWNLDVTEPIDFSRPHWESELRQRTRFEGELHGPAGVDYYLYTAGLWGEMPPFAVGRTRYDNWMIWWARHTGAWVVDATSQVFCIHQNHDRTYSSLGRPKVGGSDDLVKSVEAEENHRLAGGWDHIFTLFDAPWRLTSRGLAPVLTLTRLSRWWSTLPILNPRLRPLTLFIERVVLRPISWPKRGLSWVRRKLQREIS